MEYVSGSTSVEGLPDDLSSIEKTQGKFRAVVAGFVVGDQFRGLLDRIRHEVLADRHRTFTPEREMTAVW